MHPTIAGNDAESDILGGHQEEIGVPGGVERWVLTSAFISFSRSETIHFPCVKFMLNIIFEMRYGKCFEMNE